MMKANITAFWSGIPIFDKVVDYPRHSQALLMPVDRCLLIPVQRNDQAAASIYEGRSDFFFLVFRDFNDNAMVILGFIIQTGIAELLIQLYDLLLELILFDPKIIVL